MGKGGGSMGSLAQAETVKPAEPIKSADEAMASAGSDALQMQRMRSGMMAMFNRQTMAAQAASAGTTGGTATKLG